MKCLVCNNNIADQTGAHIFPAWMISSAFDSEYRNRDYEIIYKFSPLDSEIPYFGRSVMPDKIEETLGRNIENNEISSLHNLIVVNNLWCRSCEKKFKVCEDYFNENVDKKAEGFNNELNIQIVEFKSLNVYLLRLFFYSLMIRANLANFKGAELSGKVKSKILNFFNHYVKTTYEETLNEIEKSENKEQLLSFPIRCIKTEKQIHSTRAGVYIHDKYHRPSCFIINRYIIQFYFKGSSFNFTPNSFWGVCDYVSQAPKFLNYKQDVFYIGLMNLNSWNIVLKRMIDYYGRLRIENYITLYRIMFLKKFHFYPHRKQISKFLMILTDDKVSLGVKYTREKIIEAMNKSLE